MSCVIPVVVFVSWRNVCPLINVAVICGSCAACSSSQDEDITSATAAVVAPPLHPDECGKKEVIHGSGRTFISV